MLTGENIIGQSSQAGSGAFRAVDPSTGEEMAPDFTSATTADVERACVLAAEAAVTLRNAPLETRAKLLETIADNIMGLGDALLERAMAESGLPLARLTGERGRTVGQLRLFAAEVRDGGWLGLRVDPAMPDREPLPRSDLRLRKIALGPVAVFGASNFPLAFSVAGGDTAAALAAGCPVVCKGHPAHPGTSEMVGRAIAQAVATLGLPEGTFSMLNGTGHALGGALVADPRIKAVGFTGSRAGGLALMKIAADRPEPIPVYAEMSAINPVFLLPAALEERADALGGAFVGSLTMGAGQFCTNPGLVLAIEGPALERFLASAKAAMADAAASVMLTPGIHSAYEKGVDRLCANGDVETVARGQQADGPNRGQAALFTVAAEDFEGRDDISEEVFGASSVIVRCRDEAAMMAAAARLEGQLTATVHFADQDSCIVTALLPVLEQKAGRILANGWPTGVEVSHAMVHGGPYPATSDGRTTSVGTMAIDRFLRPVCYQDFPDALLPDALRESSLEKLPHRRDGHMQSAKV